MKTRIFRLLPPILFLLAWFPSASAELVTTKQLQIVVSFIEPDLFAYHSQNGAVITSDLTVTNPPGSTYVFKGGLFPGGTVDPAQASYTVDRNGNLLTGANSVGAWICTGTRLIDWNLSGVNFPAEGTVIEEMNWTFQLKGADRPLSEVFSKGWLRAGQLGVGGDVVLGRSVLAVLGGTGPNTTLRGDLKAHVHLSPDGLASLTIIELSNPIQIYVPD